MDSIPISMPAPAGAVRFQRLRVLFALTVREMGASFGRSAGGYFWAIAEPLGGILMLSLVFSVALRKPQLGTSFMLFYASGYVPFSTYRRVASEVSGAVRSNRGLLTYPVVTTLDAVLAKFLLATLTMFVVGVLLFTGIVLVAQVPVNFDFATILLAFFLAALFGLGVGSVNCVLFGLFPTWKNIWTIISRPTMIMSGVLFLYESVPDGFEAALWFNPLAHAIGLMRAGFYPAYVPLWVSLPYVIGISLSLFLVGIYLLRRHSSFLIEQ